MKLAFLFDSIVLRGPTGSPPTHCHDSAVLSQGASAEHCPLWRQTRPSSPVAAAVVRDINEKAFSKTVITCTGSSRLVPTLQRDSSEKEKKGEKKENKLVFYSLSQRQVWSRTRLRTLVSGADVTVWLIKSSSLILTFIFKVFCVLKCIKDELREA